MIASGPPSAFADRAFHTVCASSLAVTLGVFVWFVADVIVGAATGLSNESARYVVIDSLLQSLRLVGVALALALPLGMGAAVHLEEHARPGAFTSLVERSLALLVAVPSVLYGLFGFAVVADLFGGVSTWLAGSLTLALVLFPVVVVRGRDALRSVPSLVREASFALGADRWRALVHLILPMALPKLIAGALIAFARGLGTAAPLIVLGAFSSAERAVTERPLPIEIFASLAQKDQTVRTNSAASLVVLLGLVIVLHAIANRLSAGQDRAMRRHAQQGLSEGGAA